MTQVTVAAQAGPGAAREEGARCMTPEQFHKKVVDRAYNAYTLNPHESREFILLIIKNLSRVIDPADAETLRKILIDKAGITPGLRLALVREWLEDMYNKYVCDGGDGE